MNIYSPDVTRKEHSKYERNNKQGSRTTTTHNNNNQCDNRGWRPIAGGLLECRKEVRCRGMYNECVCGTMTNIFTTVMSRDDWRGAMLKGKERIMMNG